MIFHYDLTGAEPIIRDMGIYDAADLQNGELLMVTVGNDPDSGADEGISLVTAYSATKASQAVDAMGVLNEETYKSGGTAPTRAFSVSTGPYYGKVIINPFAVYLAEVKKDADNDLAITSTSTTTLTIGSLADDIDGVWVFFPLTQAGVINSLRYVTAAAAGFCTMQLTLTASGDSADTVIIISPPMRLATDLTDDALGLSTAGNAASIFGATNLLVLESYLQSDSHPLTPLRPASHGQLNNLSNATFWSDILNLDHMLNKES